MLIPIEDNVTLGDLEELKQKFGFDYYCCMIDKKACIYACIE